MRFISWVFKTAVFVLPFQYCVTHTLTALQRLICSYSFSFSCLAVYDDYKFVTKQDLENLGKQVCKTSKTKRRHFLIFLYYSNIVSFSLQIVPFLH